MKISKVFSLILLAMAISGCTDRGCFVFTGTPMVSSTIGVSATSNNVVTSTGVSAESGQLLRISVDTNSLRQSVKSYKAMVKFDPRFRKPVVFLATKNNGTGQYVADWVNLNNTIKANINSYNRGSINYNSIRPTRLRSIQAYVAYATRNLIPVKKDDVIHFRNMDSLEFYANIVNNPGDLAGIYNPSGSIDVTSVVTTTNQVDNFSQYFSYLAPDTRWFIDMGMGFSNPNALSYNASTTYVGFLTQQWLWNMSRYHWSNPWPHGPGCIVNIAPVEINVAGLVAKRASDMFVTAPLPLGVTAQVFQPALVYSYVSQADGFISFLTPFNSVNQFKPKGATSSKYVQYFEDIASGRDFVLPDEPYFTDPTGMNYATDTILSGRYFFEIMVGNGNAEVPQNYLDDFTFNFYIGNVSVPAGEIRNGYMEIVAPASGLVSVSLNNPHPDITGDIYFTTTAFKGISWISKNLNNNLVKPLKNLLINTTAIMFGVFTTQGNFVVFLNVCLTLYILIYGLQFALGSVKVTVKDLTDRLTKVLVISMLFSRSAWSFFNTYLFSYFLTLTDQLMNEIALATSDPTNPFGFIDPLLTQYFDPNLWFILGNYILFFGYGWILPAVLIIAGIMHFMKALIEMFFGYLTAYIGLCVMISLAPLFITACLFEYTKSMFDKWISVMVGYVLQPTLVLIFLLFINQLTSDILVKGLTQVCWQDIYRLDFNWNLGIDISIPLFTIKGYAPCLLNNLTVTGSGCTGKAFTSISLVEIFRVSALFYCLMKLAKEVVNISKTVADRLTMSGGDVTGSVSGGGAPLMASTSMALIAKPFQDAYGGVKAIVARRIRGAVQKRIDSMLESSGGQAQAGSSGSSEGSIDSGKFTSTSKRGSAANSGSSKAPELATTSDGFKEEGTGKFSMVNSLHKARDAMKGLLQARGQAKGSALTSAKDGTVAVKNPLNGAAKGSGGTTGRSSVVGGAKPLDPKLAGLAGYRSPAVNPLIQAGSKARQDAGLFDSGKKPATTTTPPAVDPKIAGLAGYRSSAVNPLIRTGSPERMAAKPTSRTSTTKPSRSLGSAANSKVGKALIDKGAGVGATATLGTAGVPNNAATHGALKFYMKKNIGNSVKSIDKATGKAKGKAKGKLFKPITDKLGKLFKPKKK